MTTTTLDRPVPLTIPDATPPVPEEVPTTPYVRLSTALRQGARFHPQGKGHFYRQGRTCALGAILVGLLGPEVLQSGPLSFAQVDQLIYQHTGVDLHKPVWPRRMGLGDIIWTMNDGDGLSREAIADWLELRGY